MVAPLKLARQATKIIYPSPDLRIIFLASARNNNEYHNFFTHQRKIEGEQDPGYVSKDTTFFLLGTDSFLFRDFF